MQEQAAQCVLGGLATTFAVLYLLRMLVDTSVKRPNDRED